MEAFTHADGKIFHSLRLLVTRPGRLTADYLRGSRKPYIAPLQIFLISNLVFFLLHPLIGSNTLTTDLHTHLNYVWHQAAARALVAPRLAARNLTADDYARVFDPAAVTLAKSLVILLVPIFSVAVMALYWRRRRHVSAHLVFALHFCSFWLLLICATLAVTNLAMGLLRYADIFPSADMVTWCTFALTLTLSTLYLFRAVQVAFGSEAPGVAATKAGGLALAFGLSLEAYRFVLFFITFWST
ncbi:MAG: hypothetical protein JWQ62_1579 [Lacunisphaera sp.]|nr:hypothetical protein [Lacunisphaera sp.]